MPNPPSKDRLQELIAQARAKLAAQKGVSLPEQTQPPGIMSKEQVSIQRANDELAPMKALKLDELENSTLADAWQWNIEQNKAIDLALQGKSFSLIGAAGTGKTTTLKEMMRRLVAENKVPLMGMSTKFLNAQLPGIVLTSFTRRAVRNIKRAVSSDLQPHCITLHKLLEYEPVFYEVTDEEGNTRTTMRFEPQRNRRNPLPSGLRTVVIDESSMVSVELFTKLLEALPYPQIQFIFLGDLHQLPPVYGQAILGFKLLELPVVELTKIYRQAQGSPIIQLAHRIKNGEEIPVSKQETTETPMGKVTIHPWKKPLSDFDATHTAGLFLKRLIENGHFNEEDDVILCPQEKIKNLAFGTNEINKVVAQTLGAKRNADVYEVIAGYERHYLAKGDRVLVGREDAIITEINKNLKYWGKRPRPHSTELDRWGNYRIAVKESDDDDMDVDKYLESFTLTGNEQEEDRKQEASHVITVEFLDSGISESFSTAGEINAMQFAYALTVHKSQGSEWERVFFLTHQSHVQMWNRELLYTAVTRARRELYMIVEPDRNNKRGTLWKAAKSPRIKGDTLEEKAEYFKGKKDAYDEMVKKSTTGDWGEAREGIRRENAEDEDEAPVVIAVPEKPPVKLVRMCELVPDAFRKEALEKLAERWTHAKGIWGHKIGEQAPNLEYDLQRSKTLGTANSFENRVRLNPVWCILASRPGNEKIKEEMLGETLDHELCHIIANRFSDETGHGSGWRMAMQLMGRKPLQYYMGDVLPNWTRSYAQIVEELKKELAEKENADISEDTDKLSQGTEV